MRNTITACAVAVLLTACGSTPEDRYQSALLACQVANTTVAIAEQKLAQDPGDEGLQLRLVGYRAAAQTACDYAASLKPAGIESMAAAAPVGAASDDCVAAAAELPEEQWEDAARACVAP